MRIQFDDELALAWEGWLEVSQDRYHIDYEVVGNSLEEHTAACLASARSTVDRLFDDYGDIQPERILDVGCSTGFKSLALHYRFPEAAVHGIDPDDVALSLGQTLISNLSGHERSGNLSLSVGYAERLPYLDRHFDAIVCVTVLEHVSRTVSPRRRWRLKRRRTARASYREHRPVVLEPGNRSSAPVLK